MFLFLNGSFSFNFFFICLQRYDIIRQKNQSLRYEFFLYLLAMSVVVKIFTRETLIRPRIQIAIISAIETITSITCVTLWTEKNMFLPYSWLQGNISMLFDSRVCAHSEISYVILDTPLGVAAYTTLKDKRRRKLGKGIYHDNLTSAGINFVLIWLSEFSPKSLNKSVNQILV